MSIQSPIPKLESTRPSFKLFGDNEDSSLPGSSAIFPTSPATTYRRLLRFVLRPFKQLAYMTSRLLKPLNPLKSLQPVQQLAVALNISLLASSAAMVTLSIVLTSYAEAIRRGMMVGGILMFVLALVSVAFTIVSFVYAHHLPASLHPLQRLAIAVNIFLLLSLVATVPLGIILNDYSENMSRGIGLGGVFLLFVTFGSVAPTVASFTYADQLPASSSPVLWMAIGLNLLLFLSFPTLVAIGASLPEHLEDGIGEAISLSGILILVFGFGSLALTDAALKHAVQTSPVLPEIP